MTRPLLLLAGGLACGCLVGAGLPREAAELLLALAAGLLCVVARAPRLHVVALLASALAVGAGAAAVESGAYDRTPLVSWLRAAPPDVPIRLAGVAAADLAVKDRGWSILLDVTTPARGRVRIAGSGDSPPGIIAGDRVEAWAALRAPRAFGDPGVFDSVAEARRAGVHAIGFCKSGRLVSAAAPTALGLAPTRWAAVARRWARGQLTRFMIPGAEEGLVRAMVLGDRTGVDPETAEAFRMAGTYHVLAISGAQVALLAGLLLSAARLLGAGPVRGGGAVASLLAFYALFVGGDPPVARAAVMAIVVLAGRALDLDSDLPNLLGLAAFLLLCHRPSAVGDASFQLSFVATAAILLLLPPLEARLPRLPWRLETAVAGSLVAQLALSPLLAVHFHRLAPDALLLNLVAVPLASAVLLAGFAILATAALAPTLAWLCADAAWIAAHDLLLSGQAARALPSLDVRVARPSLLAIALLTAGLLLVARGVLARHTFVLLAAGVTLLVLCPARVPADGRLTLTMLDVGQGDCLVVRSPRGRVMVVDTGGSWEGGLDVGESVVGPYLWSRGVLRLDRMVLTHAHPDHVGGAPFLARSFRVGDVWEGPAPVHDAVYQAVDRALRDAGSPRRTVAVGVRDADWDGVAVEVLGPRRPARAPWKARNDDSLVMTLRLGEVRFLLTGDVEREGEEALAAPRAAILKVPHHGSRTSSGPRLLAAVSPRLALVSAGYRNRFGHPHPEVVARYARAGIPLLQTAVDGAIAVSTDGSRIWLATYSGRADEVVR